MKLNRKGQEEMFGFVVIVILVIIIGVIMFIFSLKNQPAVSFNQKIQSADDLNVALLAYTTDCRDSSNQRLDVRDLIVECYRRPYAPCLNQQITVCDSLNKTLVNLTSKTELTIKSNGFRINISSNETDVFSYVYTKGELKGDSFSSTDYPILVPGGSVNFRITYFEKPNEES